MSDTPRTDAEVYGPMKRIEDEWVPDFEFVKADLARKLERENSNLRLVADYYAQGGPSDGGSYARIKLAAFDGITCAEQDGEIAKQRAEDIREHNAERMRGICADPLASSGSAPAQKGQTP